MRVCLHPPPSYTELCDDLLTHFSDTIMYTFLHAFRDESTCKLDYNTTLDDTLCMCVYTPLPTLSTGIWNVVGLSFSQRPLTLVFSSVGATDGVYVWDTFTGSVIADVAEIGVMPCSSVFFFLFFDSMLCHPQFSNWLQDIIVQKKTKALIGMTRLIRTHRPWVTPATLV